MTERNENIPQTSKKSEAIKDLTKFTTAEILELKDRQASLLKNMQRLSKLPDRGQRLKDFYAKIENELIDRNTITNAAKMFSDMNITSVGVEKINELEWIGNINHQIESNIVNNNNDDENDFAIIAQSVNNRIKQIQVVESQKSLITEQDLQEIESFQTKKKSESATTSKLNCNLYSSVELDRHAVFLCDKENVSSSNAKLKFLPHKTTKSDVHNPEIEKLRKLPKNWENTAATPPLIQHSAVKILTLGESIELEQKNRESLAKMQEQHAKERLQAKESRALNYAKMVQEDTELFKNYREQNSESDEIDSDDEVLDEEGEDSKSAVVFPVYN